ncbi:MAG: cell division protein FtsZ [Paracoccaceae bacterium]
MALNLKQPMEWGVDPELRARICVFGVGGAGGNAVNNMIEKALPGVEFIAANTDSQALAHSRAERKLQLGSGVTRGLGAGSKPEVGYTAAEETVEEISAALEGSHMCFITAGMGGGTGTGAAPVVARVAREMGILTVGVVTKPFHFEGARRMKIAEMGVAEMQKVVDTLIVIPNQNLFQVASERTTFVEAFVMADDVLYQGVQGVTDLMVRPGMINLDFADVKSVMEEMGKAMMGTGEAEGETRAIDAAEKAIANPLLDEVSLKGAKGVLINITGGYDLTLFEMDEAANRIKDEVDAEALIKFGSALDPAMEGKMRVSVVATGIDAENDEVERPTEETEPQPRRRPAETDPSLVNAVRGGTRRVNISLRGNRDKPAEAAPEAPAEPQRATGFAESIQRANARQAETAPAPQRAPKAEASAPAPAETAPAPQPQPQSVENRAAVAPSPSDMRARAERVRQRALEARARKQAAEGRAPSLGEDALWGDDTAIDEGSLAVEIVEPPVSSPADGRLAGDPAHALTARRDEPKETAAKNGLFTINKLINRVAGGSEPRIDPLSRSSGDELRAEPDDESEIPAFLRRQAN